jgi:hypothetical protein
LLFWLDPTDAKTKRVMHLVASKLQRKYEEAAIKALTYPQVQNALESLFRGRELDRVILVYKCNHFSHRVYPLNRFLVLLLARFLKQRMGMDRLLLAEHQVVGVRLPGDHDCQAIRDKRQEGDDHICQETLDALLKTCNEGLCESEHRHTVVLEHTPECFVERRGARQTIDGHIILPRFGPRDGPEMDLNDADKKLMRKMLMPHLLPYEVPAYGA